MSIPSSPVMYGFTSEPDEKPSSTGRIEAGLFLILTNTILWGCLITMGWSLL